MKVLILTHYFTPHTGGIENVAYNQAKELVKKGHQVTVLTSKIGKEKESSIIEGIKVVRVKAINTLEEKFGVPYPIFSLKAINVIKAQVLKNDVIHFHGHVYMPSVIAAYFAKKFNKASFITQHNTYINYKNIIFRGLQSLADKTLGRYTLNNSGKVIAVSKKTKEYVQSIAGAKDKTIVQYNGIDLNRFNIKKNNLELKKKLNIQNKFVCLSVRRITYKNGIDTILEVAQMLKENSKVVFLIAGKGPDLEKLQTEVKEKNLTNIILLGFVSDADLPKYYSVSDLFILPSKKGEGFPLVVLEAFASGVPVVATKSGGHEEIIKNGENGYLVEVNNPKQIFRRITDISGKNKLQKSMSDNSRKLAEEYFSWNKNINYLTSLYKQSLRAGALKEAHGTR